MVDYSKQPALADLVVVDEAVLAVPQDRDVAVYRISEREVEEFFTRLFRLSARGVRLVLTHVSAPLRDELEHYGLLAEIGEGAVYPHPADVVRAFEARRGR